VTGLETVSGVSDSLRLYLGVTDSSLAGCATMSQVWERPNLVSGRDQFYTCQTVVPGSLVYARIAGSEMGGERGDLFLRSTRHKRGSLEFNGKLL
jgi:hypothetical protein